MIVAVVTVTFVTTIVFTFFMLSLLGESRDV